MCGIVGVVSRDPVDGAVVGRMRDRLAHRGPDHAGLWLSDNRQICLGHRRLAIVDLAPEANQPFVSGDGRFVITLNGEIYNFRSIREELETRGISFRTRSDTEVLVEAFRCWGEESLGRLAGMFAFALWDTVEHRLFCARDRAGEKPFHYAMVGSSFIFASELKALLLWPGFRREIHYPALADYLCFGFVAEPKSIWEGCLKLPPGQWISVETSPGEAPTVRGPVAYWDIRFQPDHAVTDWRPAILETLRRASGEMAFADVPVGAFLSGGVDSSSVVAALSRAHCPVTAFTAGFREEEYDERPWARQVVGLFGIPHVECEVVSDDVEAVMDKLLWHYDEPFNDYSYLPTFYLCREARKIITVALSGDGADELFAGYVKYRRLALRQSVERLLPRPVTGLLAAGANMIAPVQSRLRQTLAQYRADVPRMLFDMLTTAFPFPVLKVAARGAFAETLRDYSPLDVVLELLRRAPPKEVGLVNSMRYLDLKLTLAGDMLVKVDRASMAVSLEVRPVYLHREMLDLAGRIPSALLADRGESKKVLKAALTAWLPEPLLYRRKMGFAMPLKRWMAGDLGALFGDGNRGHPLESLLDTAGLAGPDTNTRPAGGDGTARRHSLFFLRRWFETWA